MTQPRQAPAATMFAQKVMDLGDLLGARFKARPVKGSVPRILKALAPEADSTDGGKRARQSLVLAPALGTAETLVVGFVDVGAGTAELRSFAVLNEQFRLRHTRTVDLSEEDYTGFIREVAAFLEEQRITARMVTELTRPRESTATVAPQASSGGTALAVASFVLGLGVGTMLGWFARGL
jgi:hypothetical protein